nr:2-oxoacid:acceptor oxidoreductase subunit alpha [Candidatus Cloacimonadota bacterium]
LTIWPFPDDVVKKYFRNLKTIIVPELNQGQLELELKRVLENMGDRKKRRILPMHKYDGELITPSEIYNMIKEVR